MSILNCQKVQEDEYTKLSDKPEEVELKRQMGRRQH